MGSRVETELLASGGNSCPAASDSDPATELLAYGAGNNVAVWNPRDPNRRGIVSLLAGHTDAVKSVRFFRTSAGALFLLSGSDDRSVIVWRAQLSPDGELRAERAATLRLHSAAVNVLCPVGTGDLVVSGAADCELKVWRLLDTGERPVGAEVLQALSLQGARMMPLAAAAAVLPGSAAPVLAVAGTANTIAVFRSPADRVDFAPVASLAGHDGWVRSLDFVREPGTGGGDGDGAEAEAEADLLLASASQDKYVRLWRVHAGAEPRSASTTATAADPALGGLGNQLSNKPYRFALPDGGAPYTITFEALLVGHEDWVFSAKWDGCPAGAGPHLLTGSADNSVAVWERDEHTGIWVCASRLGEIAVQKGATTATGSAGGFWVAHWLSTAEAGPAVACLGSTGNWRLWRWSAEAEDYAQEPTVGGHTRAVRGLCWSKRGSYLLTASADQTTRLWAEWKADRPAAPVSSPSQPPSEATTTTTQAASETTPDAPARPTQSWHEFARPQIHGYDLNCIDAVSDSRFVSGADEKLLRVFDEPAPLADCLFRLCGIPRPAAGSLAVGASIPVLGLSNRAGPDATSDMPDATDAADAAAGPAAAASPLPSLPHPPVEDQLSKQTLWPEHEKLYGHGYEISAVAASTDGSVVATACKAAARDHAGLRLFDAAATWHQPGPPLLAHTHTVLALAFSADDRFLLSVGRDRRWALWERAAAGPLYRPFAERPAAHSRMVLAAAWPPALSAAETAAAGAVPPVWFCTAGRDKRVNVWAVQEAVQEGGEGKPTHHLLASIPTRSVPTSLSILERAVRRDDAAAGGSTTTAFVLATGHECGAVTVGYLSFAPAEAAPADGDTAGEGAPETKPWTALYSADEQVVFPSAPSASVTQLKWRPVADKPAPALTAGESHQLAVASEDGGVRVYRVQF